VYDEPAIQIATRRHGVVATWELLRRGMPHAHIGQLVASRHWERVHPTVLRRVGSAATREQRVAIGVLGCGPGTAAAAIGAARWWGASGCAQWPLEVVGTAKPRNIPTGVSYRQIRRLPVSWTTQLDGVPVVRPEMCALQLFARASVTRAARLTDSMWSRRLLSGPSIAAFLADMGAMGRNGTAGLRAYLDQRGPGYIPPESGLEARAWAILADAGIQVRRQVDVGDEQRWTGRVDGAVVGTCVLIEVQSARYHGALVDQEADRVRIAALNAAGFTVVEITDDDVWSRPDEVVRKTRLGIELDRQRRPMYDQP